MWIYYIPHNITLDREAQESLSFCTICGQNLESSELLTTHLLMCHDTTSHETESNQAELSAYFADEVADSIAAQQSLWLKLASFSEGMDPTSQKFSVKMFQILFFS